MPIRLSDVSVSVELADLINKLSVQLEKEFGCDHAYKIMGKGYILSASNNQDGIVLPKKAKAS